MSIADHTGRPAGRPTPGRASTLRLGASAATDDFLALCTSVRQLCGVDLTQYKRQQMERRVRTFVADRGSADLHDYGKRLKLDNDELGRFLDRVTINVSQLWRHPEQWKQIAELVLPALAQDKRRIRAWSAGSSYGAEAYTLAAVCRDAAPQLTVQITGTDLDPRMVERAREGRIPRADVDLAPAAALKRHFDAEPDGGWRANDALRRMARFEQGDLLRLPVRKGGYELVMCRNTVIYFNDEVRDALHERLATSLAPGGWLVVGPSERVKKAAELGLESVVPFVYRNPA